MKTFIEHKTITNYIEMFSGKRVCQKIDDISTFPEKPNLGEIIIKDNIEYIVHTISKSVNPEVVSADFDLAYIKDVFLKKLSDHKKEIHNAKNKRKYLKWKKD